MPRLPALAAVALAALLAAPPAGAQRAGGARPDLEDFVLAFVRGSFRSPLVCTFSGSSREGWRRVLAGPGPPQSERRVVRITFVDLDARDAERCTSVVGGEQPNVVGSVLVGYTAKRRSDTPDRDFADVRRAGPLELEIVSGRLRIGPPSAAPEALREVDFAGGRLRVEEAVRGSDAARVLQDLPGGRRLVYRFEAPDATRLELPLVELERR